MALEIDVINKENQDLLVFQLRGSLDTQTYAQLTDLAGRKMSKTLKGIILDLASLEYISSMGISAILQVRQMLEAQSSKLMLSNIPDHIDQVFRTVKALPDVQIFESMEEADRYLMEIQRRAKGS